MTFQEVNTMIESFGLPSSYYQFPEGTGQEPPFITFYFTGSDDLGADNINYAKIRELVIELYTDNKSFETEAVIEAALTSAGLYFSQEETFLDSERMHMVSYSMQIVITEE